MKKTNKQLLFERMEAINPDFKGEVNKLEKYEGNSEKDSLKEWHVVDVFDLPSYESYGKDPEFDKIVDAMSLIEGPIDEGGALIGYLNYAKANGISDPSKHAEIVLDVLNYFRKSGQMSNDQNAMGSREY